jgi:hypothetical protein
MQWKHKRLLKKPNACLICSNICMSAPALETHLRLEHLADVNRIQNKTGIAATCDNPQGLVEAVTQFLKTVDELLLQQK